MKIYVTNIQWDTDGEKIDLPSEITIDITPDTEYLLEDVDKISDYISDFTGFCHFGFAVDIESNLFVRALSEKDKDAVQTLESKSPFCISDMLDSENFGWGIFDGDKLLGFCSIGGADAEENLSDYSVYTNDSLLLSDVFIDEPYRGLRLGSILVQRAIRRINESVPVFCVVLDDSLKTFYTRLGFKPLANGVMVYTQDDYFPIEAKVKTELINSQAKTCPHCGVVPAIRNLWWFDNPVIISCECGFYQAGKTREEVFKAWNESTDRTLFTKLKRVDKYKDKRVIDTIVFPTPTCCENCQYRKEKYLDTVPKECKECGHLSQRNSFYSSESPVYQDEDEIFQKEGNNNEQCNHFNLF